MILLTNNDISIIRQQLYDKQNGICFLCSHKIKNPVLDHNHKTGIVRGCICAGCNRILGKIENNYRRYNITDQQLKIISPRVYDYIQKETEYLHPKTPKKIKDKLVVKLGKREYNKLMKYWHILYPKRKKPEYPKSKTMTKEFEIYINKLNEFLGK